MYVRYYREKVTDDPRPMYQNCSELIEADGEVLDLFIIRTVREQYPTQKLIAIDWVNGDEIDLDIADYIGQGTFDTYENIFYNMDESETFSHVKADSFLKACIQNTRRKKGSK